MHMAAPTMHEWLSTRECLRLLGCSYYSFRVMVADGLIRRRDVPGYRRYWRADVERLAAPPDTAA